MNLLQTRKTNLKRPPVALFNVNEHQFVVTKGLFVELLNQDRIVVYKHDVGDDIIDACSGDDFILVITKGGRLLKIETNKIVPISLKFRACSISYISKTKETVVGSPEGKIVFLNGQFKPTKSLYLLTDCINLLDSSIKNKLLVSCVNSNSLFVIDIKRNDKKSIQLEGGEVTAFAVYNKKHIVVGTEEGWLFYVSLESNEIISKCRFEHPICGIKSSPSFVTVGTSSGQLLFVEIIQEIMKIKHREEVCGVVNGIEIDNNKLVVLCGREEKKGAFYKNKAFKNVLLDFTIH